MFCRDTSVDNVTGSSRRITGGRYQKGSREANDEKNSYLRTKTLIIPPVKVTAVGTEAEEKITYIKKINRSKRIVFINQHLSWKNLFG